MKRYILLLLLSLGIGYAQAGHFKVLFVNDANLKYTNGKIVKVGDTFSDANDIAWQKEKQAVLSRPSILTPRSRFSSWAVSSRARLVSMPLSIRSASPPTMPPVCPPSNRIPSMASSTMNTCCSIPLRFPSRKASRSMTRATSR